MGCFVETCMASGLPIPRGTKAKIIIVEEGDHRFRGHYVTDLYQVSSFPVSFIMDDYGGHETIPESNSKASKLIEEMTYPKSEWWLSAIIQGRSGRFDSYERESFVKKGVSYYRADIWDELVKIGKTQITCVPEELELYEEILDSINTDLENMPLEEIYNHTIYPSCNRFTTREIMTLLRTGKYSKWANKENIINVTLSKEDRLYFLGEILDVFLFTLGMEAIGRPILPSVSLAGQGALYDVASWNTHSEFNKFCSTICLSHVEQARREGFCD